jgi:hypothetical protein
MSDSKRIIGPERKRERERVGERGEESFRRVENIPVYRSAKCAIFITFC